MVFGSLTPYRGAGIARRDPFGGSLFDLHRQMNRLFDDLFDQDTQSSALTGRMGFPALDVSQDENRIRICAELPGVREEDVDLSIEDGVLTLCGEKKSEREDEERGYSERSYGRFERRISLPSNVDEDACEAHFDNGVLTVTIPVSEEKARGRRIPLGKSRAASGQGAEGALIEQEESQKESKEAKKQEKQNA